MTQMMIKFSAAKIVTINRQQGLSLIELMVAMLLGLILMGSVVAVVLNSKSSFVGQRELAMVQENGRYAMEMLTKEIRMAGYQDCARQSFSKLGNSINTSYWYVGPVGLKGYEGPADSTLPLPASAGWTPTVGDSLVVKHGETSSYSLISNSGSTITVNKVTDIQQGEPVLMVNADCTEVALFQKTNAAGSSTIDHQTGTVSPGNITSNVYVALSKPSFDYTNYTTNSISTSSFSPGSTIMRYSASAFYVRNSTVNSTPSLFRKRLITATVSGTGTLKAVDEELAQGVEDLQFLYGVDTDTDGIANRYLVANDALLTDWKKVVSVQITLSLRSINPVYLKNTDYTKCDGTTTTYFDKYIHKCMSSTVSVRNNGS